MAHFLDAYHSRAVKTVELYCAVDWMDVEKPTNKNEQKQQQRKLSPLPPKKSQQDHA
jgi:hypothetical protein